jgi:hypothetical protein
VRATALAWLLAVSACASRDPLPVDYVVGVDVHPGIEVRVDGVALPAGQDSFGAQYEDFLSARVSPLFVVETWKDGAPVDAIEIGFGACERLCADPEVRCVGELTILEQVSAPFDADGVFLPSVDTDPRAWRGVGCLRCEFSDRVNVYEECGF